MVLAVIDPMQLRTALNKGQREGWFQLDKQNINPHHVSGFRDRSAGGAKTSYALIYFFISRGAAQ